MDPEVEQRAIKMRDDSERERKQALAELATPFDGETSEGKAVLAKIAPIVDRACACTTEDCFEKVEKWTLEDRDLGAMNARERARVEKLVNAYSACLRAITSRDLAAAYR